MSFVNGPPSCGIRIPVFNKEGRPPRMDGGRGVVFNQAGRAPNLGNPPACLGANPSKCAITDESREPGGLEGGDLNQAGMYGVGLGVDVDDESSCDTFAVVDSVVPSVLVGVVLSDVETVSGTSELVVVVLVVVPVVLNTACILKSVSGLPADVSDGTRSLSMPSPALGDEVISGVSVITTVDASVDVAVVVSVEVSELTSVDVEVLSVEDPVEVSELISVVVEVPSVEDPVEVSELTSVVVEVLSVEDSEEVSELTSIVVVVLSVVIPDEVSVEVNELTSVVVEVLSVDICIATNLEEAVDVSVLISTEVSELTSVLVEVLSVDAPVTRVDDSVEVSGHSIPIPPGHQNVTRVDSRGAVVLSVAVSVEVSELTSVVVEVPSLEDSVEVSELISVVVEVLSVDICIATNLEEAVDVSVLISMAVSELISVLVEVLSVDAPVETRVDDSVEVSGHSIPIPPGHQNVTRVDSRGAVVLSVAVSVEVSELTSVVVEVPSPEDSVEVSELISVVVEVPSVEDSVKVSELTSVVVEKLSVEYSVEVSVLVSEVTSVVVEVLSVEVSVGTIVNESVEISDVASNNVGPIVGESVEVSVLVPNSLSSGNILIFRSLVGNTLSLWLTESSVVSGTSVVSSGLFVERDVVSLEGCCVVASVVAIGLAVLNGLLRTRGRAVTVRTSLSLSLQPYSDDIAINTKARSNI